MICLRTLLVWLLLAVPLPLSARAEATIIVQQSPLAGFQYYDGKALWDDMKPGDTLMLVREPANPHDANAVRVEWNGSHLGYIPRRENADVARQMDRGAYRPADAGAQPVAARVIRSLRRPEVTP